MIKKVLSIILTVAVILSCATFPSFATATAEIVIYPEYPDLINRDYDYEVSVSDGVNTYSLPVYNATRNIDSFDGVKNTDSWRRFCEFSFEGEVTVTIKTRLEMQSASVLPSAKGINFTVSDNTITFTLSNPENVIVRLNDDNNTILSIFAESLEEFDYQAEINSGRKVIYFEAGLNNYNAAKSTAKMPSQISNGGQGAVRLGGNTTVYLAPGAVVTSRFYLRDDNVTFTGRGAILDPHTSRGAFGSLIMVHHQPGFNEEVNNTTIKGIKLLDAHCFVLNLLGVNGVLIDNVKLLASEISTDGISTYGENINIENSFLYVSDDTFVVGNGTQATVKNTTTGSSASLTHIHTHSKYGDISFENVNVFRMGDFFRNVEANTASVYTSDYVVKMKNLNAVDTLNAGAFARLQSQGGDGEYGGKHFYLENVALPAGRNVIWSYDAGVLNVYAKGVYIGGELLSSTSQLETLEGNVMSTQLTRFNFEFSQGDPSSLALTANTKSANYVGENFVKVGGYQIPYDKNTVKTVNGVTYLPVKSLMENLGFEVKVTNKITLTHQNGVITLKDKEINYYGLKQTLENPCLIEDGWGYISLDTLTKYFNASATTDGKNVFISATYNGENLIKDGEMEDLSGEFLAQASAGYPSFAYSTNWTHYNQPPYYESTDSYNGETALEVVTGNKTATGITQYLGNAIKKYGAGTYRFTAYVKKGSETVAGKDDTYTGTKIEFGIAQATYRIRENGVLIGVNDVKEFTLTDSWQKITYDVVITDPDRVGYDRSFLYIATSKDEFTHFLVDEVSVTIMSEVASNADLEALLKTNPTREGKAFKGWYDSNGNLYTASSTVSSPTKLYPEFISLEGFDSEKVEETKLLAVAENLAVTPDLCRLGIHYDRDGQGLVYNVVDSEGDMSVPENKALKQGSFTIPKATTYHSQARYWDGEKINSGTLFKAFEAKIAPENYTPKTVALLYSESEKVFYVPKTTTLYVGDTIIFETSIKNTDKNPVPQNASFINGMYLQGVQVRVGGLDTSTGLRFINVNNLKLIELLKANFKDVEYGTLVMSKDNLTSKEITISTPKSIDAKALKIYHTAQSLGRFYQKYTACVTKIPVEQLTTNVVARPYIKYTDLSETERYIYGEQYATNIYTVAIIAYQNSNEDLEVKNYLFNEIINKVSVGNDLNIDF